MYSRKPKVYVNSQNKKTKPAKKHFSIDSIFNYHGLNNKNFLRALTCVCFTVVITVSFLLIANYTKHHSYYMQEDASISTTKYAARNDIFDESTDTFDVSVTWEENTISVSTVETTVQALLDELNIDMSDKEPSMALDAQITEDSSITLYNVEYRDTTETQVIPYKSETVDVSTVPYGTDKVVTKGVNGSTVRTVREKIVDGKVISSTVISEKTTPPTNEVIHHGAGGYFTGDDGVEYHYSHYIDVQATAYTAPHNARTASGEPVSMSVIAVDPRVIPLGTKVYVASDYYDCGVRYALDTGSAVKGRIIDVFMGTDSAAYSQALSWGRRSARVYILVD